MEALKAAYRSAAALHHPDRGGSHQTMVGINEAYQQAKWELERGIRNNPQCSPPQPQPQSQPQPQARPPQPEPGQEQIREFWMYFIDRLIDVQETNEYKSGWVAYQLLDSKVMPPMVAWEYLGERLGHKPGWAHYKFKEWRFDSPKQHAT
jgi:curved DNA-binding protein CbpA